MSSVPVSPPPHERPQQPVRVSTPESKPRGRGWIWGLLLVAIGAAACGTWYWRSQAVARQTATATLPGLRSQSVSSGTLESSIRLTGVTAAENYVSLTSPQLRGSRSGQYGRAGATFSSGVNTSINVPSNAGKSNAVSTGGKSSALIAATSRAGGSGGSSSSSAGSGSGTSPSASSGAEGIGSTSAAFNGPGGPGGGGGGGGGGFGGEFSLSVLSLAKSGATIKKDEVVAEFDRTNMLNRVDDYKASVAQTEASYRNLVAQLTVGKKAKLEEIEKSKALVEKAKLDLKTIPVLSNMDAERMKLAFESAEANYKTVEAQLKMFETGQQAQIRGAEIELEQGKIELRRTENNAAKMIVKAPIPGLVVVQQAFRGSEFMPIQQGDQLMPGQFFMQIVDISSMVVNVTVNQVDAEKMRIGARARIRFDAYPNLELPGHVMSVGGLAKGGGARQSFVKELPVRIKLEKIDPRVIPDLSVSAEVILGQEENATIAPLAAVYRDEPNGPAYVYVRQPVGWTRREVELGLESYLGVAVRQGLKPGDIVALDRPPETSKS